MIMSRRGRLTHEEQQKYIDEEGGSCPYCGDGDMSSDSFYGESMTVWRKVTCLKCHRAWQDIYTLVECSDEFTFDEEAKDEDSNLS